MRSSYVVTGAALLLASVGLVRASAGASATLVRRRASAIFDFIIIRSAWLNEGPDHAQRLRGGARLALIVMLAGI